MQRILLGLLLATAACSSNIEASDNDLTCVGCDPLAGSSCDQGCDGSITCITPIILDLAGDGFHLTSLEDGVYFDMRANGNLTRTSWTEANSDDAWLVVDFDDDGMITSSAQMFGHASPQPLSVTVAGDANGYRALTLYDDDQDGWVDASDYMWSILKLWRDVNHDGVSDSSELFTLDEYGITGLSTDFVTRQRRDGRGNFFRYAADIQRTSTSTVGPKSYDVIPVVDPENQPSAKPLNVYCQMWACREDGYMTTRPVAFLYWDKKICQSDEIQSLAGVGWRISQPSLLSIPDPIWPDLLKWPSIIRAISLTTIDEETALWGALEGGVGYRDRDQPNILDNCAPADWYGVPNYTGMALYTGWNFNGCNTGYGGWTSTGGNMVKVLKARKESHVGHWNNY